MTLVIVLAVIIVVWALVEIVQADAARVRRLPKWAWAVIAVLSPIGALAWFWLGRPKVPARTPGQPSARSGGVNLPKRQRYVARPAPDDDPEFLRKLNAEAEQQRMLRRMQEDLEARKPTGEPGDETRPQD